MIVSVALSLASWKRQELCKVVAGSWRAAATELSQTRAQ